jgi:RsiW-degrading membrane proteinase PrsW (M82 family)
MAKNRDQTKKKKKPTKPTNDSGDSSDDDSRKRTMWIVLAVLAILAVVLWFLHRRGILQRWFPSAARRPYYSATPSDYSPSAPPFPTNGF